MVADASVVAALVSCIAVFFIGNPEPALRFLVVFVLLLIPRHVGIPPPFRAAFGGVLLVATWVGAAHWYDAWWVDLVVHFFLPATTAAMAYFVLGRLDRVPDVSDAPFSRHPSGLIVLVVAIGLAIAALWEMYEWAALAIFPSPSIATGYDDTILDLAMGGAGGVRGEPVHPLVGQNATHADVVARWYQEASTSAYPGCGRTTRASGQPPAVPRSLRSRLHMNSAPESTVTRADVVVVPLDDERATEATLTGAKAATLAVAAAAPLPVITGFVITSAATSGDVEHVNFDREIKDAWERLSDGGRIPLVVRSSSVAEDLAATSMAGRFKSVVGVRGRAEFRAAVDKVLASRKALAEAGEDAGHAPLAVLAQRQVQAAVGGVMFSADPVTGDARTVVVSAVEGGPESLVSGEANGSTYKMTPDGELKSVDRGRDGAELDPSVLLKL